MKRQVVLMSAVLLMMSSAMFAQTNEKHHRKGEGRLEKFKTELSLNDDQYASIKGINRKYAEQISKLRNDSTVSRNEKQSSLHKLRNEKEKEIGAVLTVDQKTKYETLKAARAEKRKEHLKARGERHQAQMIRDLSLTDEQAANYKEANKGFAEKVKALREKSEAGKSLDKEEIKKLRKDNQAVMQSILTPEQFLKWKEIRKSPKVKHKK